MERAAKVLGKELKYNKITDPSEAKYEFGTIDILETGDYDTDSIEWGKEQEACRTDGNRLGYEIYRTWNG